MKNGWERNIALFISSQTISLFGSSLVQYAIIWHITLDTKSGLMLTLSILCGYLPTFLISPFAGVWADRYSKRLMIILSDALTAFATLVLAIVFMAGYENLGILFTVSAIRSVGAGIQTPTVGSFIPALVPDDQLTRINGINGSIQSIISIAAPILSGALLKIAVIEVIFFIDVFTAIIAIIIMSSLLKVRETINSAAVSTDYFSSMTGGIKYILGHRFAKTLFVYCSINMLLVGPLAFLTPLQVTITYGDDVLLLTLTEVSLAIGMVFGGVIISVWGGFRNKLHTIIASYLTISVCAVMLGIVGNFAVYLFFILIIGIALPFFNTPFMVLIQQNIESEYLGRILSAVNMISSSIMPIGMLVYGPLADIVKIEWMLIVTGSVMFIISMSMLRNKTLMTIDHVK